MILNIECQCFNFKKWQVTDGSTTYLQSHDVGEEVCPSDVSLWNFLDNGVVTYYK